MQIKELLSAKKPLAGFHSKQQENTVQSYNSQHNAEACPVIIPADNEADLAKIDQTVRKALNFVAVDHMDRVVELALQGESSEGIVCHPPVQEKARRSVRQ